ncbi:GntR family transcriptional regulator [Ramlibacter tataouinensis]|uniref:Transcriptional regulator, GntR family-like protein n=1 Tax=Ramlibacter tataouinensis (strain ATCC BAA-407 / DSM 14655 / LMG 21543 / TTB310) TaxID=365046 RepID=F5Y5I7_RAMTT|nr:FCD domain-containing protein [Ramlibacter tataouinensis]AEG92683.1 transcriptional regulator, GntR family-like protein [Ramlibacter tataouinensis TTB310]
MSSVPTATTESPPLNIAEQIKQLIYAGEFKAGDRLNEAALAVRMGTSRGPIREAIRILAGTGLVTPVPNRGVYVRQVSIREMLEIYELRALVFGFAAERACENITDAGRARFEALLDGMDRAAAENDSNLYYDLNVQFHELVLVLCNHQRARLLYDSYVKELHLYRRQNFNAPGNMRRSNVEHRKLYEAISKGNVAKAKQYAQEHIQAGRQRLLALADEK